MTDNIPTTDERWLPIPGYEGWYEVSDYGRVKSLQRKIFKNIMFKTIIFKNRTNPGGYFVSTLIRNKIRNHVSVHSLVMLAFVGPRPDGLQINHIDFDRKNNRLENLEYVTPRQNTIHSIERLRKNTTRGEKVNTCKIKEKEIAKIRQMMLSGKKFGLIASEYGVSYATIRAIFTRKTWKHVE